MIEGNKAAIKLLVSYEQLAKAVEPTVRHLDDPAPSLLFGITFEFAGLLPPSFDVRNVTVPGKDFQRRPAGIARVGTQVLASSLGRLGTLDHDGIQYGPQLRDVMPVGAGHDER